MFNPVASPDASLLLKAAGESSVRPCVHARSLQSCPTLCDPMDGSSLGSSVHGILQARIRSGLPCLSPGDLSDTGIEPNSLVSLALAGS